MQGVICVCGVEAGWSGVLAELPLSRDYARDAAPGWRRHQGFLRL